MDELLGLFEHLFDSVSKLSNLLYDRTTTNVTGTFKNMTLKQYIRLVMIVGAYMLFRKYVIVHGARFQQRQMEKREAADKAEEEKRNAEMTPNQLRGAELGLAEDTDSEGEDAAASSGAVLQFGKKARRRQRNAIKKILDAEEERLRQLQEDEEDKDIQEFLIG
ncbi:Protein trafficking PGA2 [Microdochium nivale]|nr:Protein trafficking PGA2 [Microdochium nivale]